MDNHGLFFSFVSFLLCFRNGACQRWSRGHKARGQGQGHKKNPRPRTAFPRTDTLEAKDRNARGQVQGHKAQVLSKKKKKRSSQKFFRRSPKKKKKVFTKIFQAISTKKRFPIFEDLRSRGQGLQNVSSRTPPLVHACLMSYEKCQ